MYVKTGALIQSESVYGKKKKHNYKTITRFSTLRIKNEAIGKLSLISKINVKKI